MTEYTFRTKAETLEYLYNHMDELGAGVFNPFFFSAAKWGTQKDAILVGISHAFSGIQRVIVRSSAKSEDSAVGSMAGKYESVICSNNQGDVAKAVDSVLSSYGTVGDMDQVLVQEAIEDAECAGVAFTMDPNTGGQYFVINYDDKTGSTSSVTSGGGRDTKLFYWFSGSDRYPTECHLAVICRALEKLKSLLGRDALDVEFLFSKNRLYILQARPLIVDKDVVDMERQGEALKRIARKVHSENQRKPYLYGRRTVYGVMPDWNPAEMIGIHPRNLAASLYKEIITDNVWAYQRDNYGYKMLRSFPLMVDFCGFPYIDVRVSFNSFIPACLEPKIAEKLVNYYLDRLEAAPEKHDKVEFDIVFSCYTFDLPKRIQILKEHGFTDNEIETITSSLRILTRKISNSENGLWKKDAEKLSILESRRETIENSRVGRVEKIFWLLEDCKRYGTLPFAGLARAGFIAVQLLKSMVAEGIITQEENDAFMNDLETSGSRMKADFISMGRDDFLKKYGFLRPGTYDICSSRYDEAPGKYFVWGGGKTEGCKGNGENFRLSLAQMERIRDTLAEHGMGEDVLGLFSFIKGAIEGREWAKFAFTRNVSDILKLFGEWGGGYGFSRDDLSYADIQIVKEAYCGAADEKKRIQESIDAGKDRYHEGVGISLPPLIVSESEIFSFAIPDLQPNFITQQRIEAELCQDIGRPDADLDGKVVMIESADPGYDWIFSHNIKGFITKYGGANSHMAIRAGELAVPAVVGAGARIYDSLKDAFIVEIDAPKKIVRALR